MRTTLTTNERASRLEPALVVGFVVLGALLRLWGPGRLGLVHFDEGIYAMAGAWIGRSDGLDPMVIPYAPGGYPLLVGVAYLVLGMSDVPAILVSVAAGSATIALAAWVARRAFGPGAAVAAAALAALSGPEIAFSRMALTDATALLCWLLALAAGGWFLDRPGLVRSVALGLAVGLAQNVKYSGFLAGVAVALAALVPTGGSRGESARSLVRRLAFGVLAAVVAAAVYWPWFAFVEHHGGYAALMRHHRGYVAGWTRWAGNFPIQMAGQTALSGRVVGPVAFSALAWSLAWLGARLTRKPGGRDRFGWAPLPSALMVGVLGLVPTASWWVALARVPFWLRSASGTSRVLAMAWLVQTVLTPLYHPYARLWLPLEALGWFALAEMATRVTARREDEEERQAHENRPAWVLAGAVCASLVFAAVAIPGARPGRGLLGPSDGLQAACDRLAERIEEARRSGAFSGAKVLARPPVLFYLAQRGIGPLMRVEDRDALFRQDGPSVWAIEDSGVDQGRAGGSPDGWQIEARSPARLTIPARLDLDPASALERDPGESPLPSTWLALYRPGP